MIPLHQKKRCERAFLAAPFFDQFPGAVLNTHPSLLPNFKGWHAVEDALAVSGLPAGNRELPVDPQALASIMIDAKQ